MLADRSQPQERRLSNPVRRNQCHSHGNETTLRSPRREGFLNPKLVEQLECHDGCVPVGLCLRLPTMRQSMAQRLDCDEIGGVDKLLVGELGQVVVRRGGEGVEQDQRRFGMVQNCSGRAIANLDSSQMGDAEDCPRWNHLCSHTRG